MPVARGKIDWWVSCRKFTVRVTTNSSLTIIEAAPIVRVFVGQPLDNLKRWADGFGGLLVERLGTNASR